LCPPTIDRYKPLLVRHHLSLSKKSCQHFVLV